MSNYKVSKYLTVSIIALLGIFAVLFYFLAVPKLINIDKYRPEIESQFKDRTGFTLRIDKLESSMLINGIKIYFTDISLKHPDNSPFVSANKGFITIPFLGLLQRQVIIKEIKVNKFYANIKRLETGKLDIAQLLLSRRKPGEIEVKLKNTTINVDNYRVVFTDEYVKPVSKYIITGNDINIYDFDPLKYIRLKIAGKIATLNRPDTSFNISYASELPLKTDNIAENEPVLYGQVNNLYPDMFQSYFNNTYLTNSIKSGDIRLNINLEKTVFRPRYINTEIFLNSVSESLNKSRIYLQSTIKDNLLDIDELSLKGKNMNVLMNGSVRNYSGKNPLLNLFLTVNRLKLSNIIYLLPDKIKFGKNYTLHTRKYSADGDLNANILIKGQATKPEISGQVHFKNFYLSHINSPEIIKNASGSLILKKRKIEFVNVFGFIGQSKVNIDGYYNLEGISNIKAAFSSLDIGLIHKFISGNSDFNEINKKLNNIKNVSGLASGALNFTGAAANLKTSGNFALSNIHIAYKGISKPFEKINGIVKFAGNNIYLQKAQGIFAGSLYKADGEVINSMVKASVISDSINLTELYSVLRQSSALKSFRDQLSKVSNISGNAGIKVYLSGKIGENIFKNAEIEVTRVSFLSKQLGFPVVLQGRISAAADKILIHTLNANILGENVQIDGSISGIKAGRIVPDLKVISKNLDVRIIERLRKLPIVPKEVKDSLNDFSGFRGNLTVNARIQPNNYVIDTKFNRVFAVYNPQKIHLRIRKGGVRITPKVLAVQSVHSRIARTALFLDGQVTTYRFKPDFNLVSAAKIDSRDIDKYINPYLDEPIKVSGKIPVNAIVEGNFNNLKLLSKITLDKGVDLVLPKGASLPKNKLRVISFAGRGNKSRIDIDSFNITLDQTQNILNASGTIDKIDTSDKIFRNLHIVNPAPMDITLLNPMIEYDSEEPFFASGDVKADLLLDGSVSSPEITGNIELNNDVVPSRSLNVKHAVIKFADNDFILDDSSIIIAGSDLKVKAIADKTFKLPLNIRTVEINSNSLNLDKVKNAVIKPANGEKPESIPVTVQNGLLRANEFIISNFITNNLVTSFTLTPDWLLTMPDLSLEAADGKAYGRVIYNTQTTVTSGIINAEGMSANAAATIFLNLPNEVYGTLKGTAQFETKGTEKNELISNASGTASFSIVDGRLTRLGSLEYLLLAANTLSTGLAGINLNSILNLIAPQNTGNFDILDGKLTVEKGVLSTDDVKTQGKNLSLYLSGKMDMLTNYSDMTILGRVSRRVSGLLGPLGSISINTFVEYIPGLGFIPGTGGRGLISMIPFLSRIPILGLGKGKYRRFVVEIQGDLYDPKSVKSFRWLD